VLARLVAAEVFGTSMISVNTQTSMYNSHRLVVFMAEPQKTVLGLVVG
jgi:hypothetical protein